MNSYDFICGLIIAFIASLLLTPLITYLARKFNIMDKPDEERKIHKKAVPLLGGLAIFFSLNAVVLLYAFFSNDLTGDTIRLKNIIGMLIGTLILAVGGFLDDKFNLRPKWQIFFPILAVLSVIFCGIGIDFLTNPFGDGVLRLDKYNFIMFWYHGFPYKITLLADIFTFIWLLAMIYTTKLLDGLDGLVSGITVIGAIFIFLTALNKADIVQYDVALLATVIVGSFLGFLVFNFNPASIFLGEGGSTIAGFLLGSLSIISGSKVGITLMLLSIPALDVIWTIIRRIIDKKSPFTSSDKKHLHYRLLDAGMSIKRAVLFLYCIALAFGAVAYSLQDSGVSLLAAGIAAVAIFLLILGYLYKRIKEQQRALDFNQN